MRNYKVRVSNEAESKEVQELFFELGYEWYAHGKNVSYLDVITTGDFGYLVAWKPGCSSKHIIQMGCGKEDAKEITLPQLRDIVVLKRNSIEDATHIRCDGKKYFHAKSTDYFYQFSNDGEWLLSTWMNYQLLPQLKPIEKPMKEWLNTETYEYKKAVDMGGHSKWIEIPEGAIKLVYSITNNNHYPIVTGKQIGRAHV